jgi:hypothetical protein
MKSVFSKKDSLREKKQEKQEKSVSQILLWRKWSSLSLIGKRHTIWETDRKEKSGDNLFQDCVVQYNHPKDTRTRYTQF